MLKLLGWFLLVLGLSMLILPRIARLRAGITREKVVPDEEDTPAPAP